MARRIGLTSFTDWMIRRRFTAAGLRAETHEIDGGETTIHCWLPSAAAGEKNDRRPTLVLLHGFGPAATWQWHSQVNVFSRHFSLIIPDLLFFGGSTTKSSHRSEIFQAESVLKLLDELGVDRFSVVGTSYGGFVGFHVARLGGERVDRVVIASSDLMKTELDDQELLGRAKMGSIGELILPRSTGSLRTLIDLAMRRKLMFVPEFILRDILQSLYSNNVESKLELIHGLELNKHGEISRSSLLQEVLLVWGDDDGIFPLKKAHLLKENLGEKARLEVIKNTGHVPQIENPSRFNELIISFLNEQECEISKE